MCQGWTSPKMVSLLPVSQRFVRRSRPVRFTYHVQTNPAPLPPGYLLLGRNDAVTVPSRGGSQSFFRIPALRDRRDSRREQLFAQFSGGFRKFDRKPWFDRKP